MLGNVDYVRLQLLDLAHSGGSIVLGAVSGDNHPVAARAWAIEEGEDGELLVVVHNEPALCGALVPGASVSVTAASVISYQAIQCRGVVAGTSPLTGDQTSTALRRSQVFVEQVARTHYDSPELVAAMVPHDLLGVRVIEGEFFDQSPRPRENPPA